MNNLSAGFLLFAVLILGLTIFGDSQQTTRLQQELDLETLNNLTIGIEKFSLTLWLRPPIDVGYENFVVCPLSVWMMLTVLTEGAKDNTHFQLSTCLRHPQNNKQILRDAYKVIEKAFTDNTTAVELAAVNSFFVDKNVSISNEYLNLSKNDYNTQIKILNFSDPNAAKLINDAVVTATRGKISQIVKSGDLRNSKVVLSNAVYFRGQWELPFNASLTKREPFYDTEGNAIGEVNLMYRRGPFTFVNMRNFKAHVVELPYGRERRLSMIVMIPYDGVSLMELCLKFTKIPMADLLNALKEAASEYEDNEVDVYLPRFKIDTDFVLNQILFNMGIQDVFDASYADLSGITNDTLFLSKVLHKVSIEVTEEGNTETNVTDGELSHRIKPLMFKANKPFLYFIYENTKKLIILAGNYYKPSLYYKLQPLVLMLKLVIVLCLLSVITAYRSQVKYRTNTEQVSNINESNLSESIDQFSISLLQSTVFESGDQNTIVSPFSIWTLLTLMSDGAYGDTFKEFSNTLNHLKDRSGMREAYKNIEKIISSEVTGIRLEVDNEIFGTHELQINTNYSTLVKNLYKTRISLLNFNDPASLIHMNQVISNATHGKITDAFKKEDLITASMFLSNTIFFKGGWTFPFKKELTKEEPFFDDKNREIGKVNMMYQSGPFAQKYFKNLGCDIVELPYGEVNCNDFYDIMPECNGEKAKTTQKSRFSMVLVVPLDVSLDHVLTKLSNTSIKNLFAIMDNDLLKNTDQLEVYMPRFKISSDLSMKKILQGMGIVTAFDPVLANFSGIASNKELYLSKVSHKAFIDVTEDGTVASAATIGMLVDRITPGKLKLDRPFMFMIVEKSTNSIVFSGTYRKPYLH
ncbi:uncharacterized protein LOC143914106 [Arctopsyche grandis]|uniref:uncharacterized protein LOC143914106 n=1 Tax=Arctopsyche grandis TaxID=121162 RepID=UPI00406D6E28